jgi:competence protein ComEA
MLVKRIFVGLISMGLMVSVFAGTRPHRMSSTHPVKKLTQSRQIPTEKINLNQADVQSLIQIKGIGKKKAMLIIQYRQKHGIFRSVDDLIKVRGIGTKRLEKIKPFLRV